MDLQHWIALDQRLTLALNGSESLFWDGVMSTITSTFTWLPVAAVLIYVIIKNNCWRDVWVSLLSIALAIFLADMFSAAICKPFFQRFRPTQDPFIMYQVDVVDNYRGGLYGFISGHASNTFAMAMLLSLLIRDRRLTFAVFAWAAIDTYSRVYLGVHYVGDVLAGTLSGLLWGGVSYFVFTRLRSKSEGEHLPNASSTFTSAGYSTTDVSILLSALFLTFVYTMFQGVFYQ